MSTLDRRRMSTMVSPPGKSSLDRRRMSTLKTAPATATLDRKRISTLRTAPEGVMMSTPEASTTSDDDHALGLLDKAQARSFRDLGRIRLLSVLAALLHLGVTAVLLIMGFTKNNNSGEKYSTSIVVASFGSLISVIWAVTGSWEMRQGYSDMVLPAWTWHNSSFIQSFGLVSALTIFLWPSIVIFIIHRVDGSFFDLLFQVQNKGTALFLALLIHFGVFFAAFVVNSTSILGLSRILAKFQNGDVDGDGDGDGDAPITEGEEGDDEAAMRPAKLPSTLRRLIIITMIVDALIVVDMVFIVTLIPLNSGIIGGIVVQSLSLLAMGAFVRQLLSDKIMMDVESWVFKWRAIVTAHSFFLWVLFWVSLGIVVLLGHKNIGFFEAITLISSTGMAGSTLSKWLVYIELALFAVYMTTYALLLHFHARCMHALDEIESIRLFQQHNHV